MHATERARLREKERRRRLTKEAAFAFRTFRTGVTRHKRGTKQQAGKLARAQGESQRSKGAGQCQPDFRPRKLRIAGRTADGPGRPPTGGSGNRDGPATRSKMAKVAPYEADSGEPRSDSG
jgi:hypothetical protein